MIARMRSEIQSVHFSGICGTAMASVAVALRERGWRVTGSDEGAYPPMSDFLRENGIEIRTPYAAGNLADQPDLVVVGNALSRGNPEVEAVLARRLHFVSLPELVKELVLRGRRPLVVAGTHGKTTTASLLAWVLEQAGRNPGFLIGGLPQNLGRGARFTDGEWFVIEGDEYDTAFFDKRGKFLHYLPEVAILNNLELDHVDIYQRPEDIQRAFAHFLRLVPPNGLVLANGDDPGLLAPLAATDFCPIRRFGFGPENDLRAADRVPTNGDSLFQVGDRRFRLPLAGEHNVRNALAVLACARYCGLSDDEIQAGFETFQGVRRRMEVRGEVAGVTVIDDFAHHPTAIAATLQAVREKCPQRRVWALFEPRSNTTRRSTFQEELTRALGQADVAAVAPIARPELLAPEKRLNTDRIAAELRATNRQAVALGSVQDIVDYVLAESRPGDVLCVLSNGGFGGIHQKLLDGLAARPG